MTTQVLIAAPAFRSDHPRLGLKIAADLVARGWKVTFIGQCLDATTPLGVECVELDGGCRWSRLRVIPTLIRELRQRDADIVLSAGHEAWIAAIVANRFRARRVAFDAIEDYRGSILSWFHHPKMARVAAAIVSMTERHLSRRSDVVIVSRRGFVSRYPAPRVETLYNVFPSRSPTFSPVRRPPDKPLRIAHLGMFGEERGSLVLAHALIELGARGVPIEVHVVGGFVDGTEPILAQAAARSPTVVSYEYSDWRPFDEALAAVAEAHVGLILFGTSRAGLGNPMPNKVFDYAAAGLAQIAPSAAPELAEIVRSCDAGLLVDTEDPIVVADALQHLYEDEEERFRFAKSAQEKSACLYGISEAMERVAKALIGN